MLSIHSELASDLLSSRMIQVIRPTESETATVWLTEGNKMRLRRAGVDFIDWTGRTGLVDETFEAEPSEKTASYKLIPDLPELTHQADVRKVFPHLSTMNMFEMLEIFTSYYNRLYTSQTGVKSQRWLFDEITDVRFLSNPF